MLSRQVLGEALGVTISDYRCRAHPHPDGPEEVNDSHSVVFVRRGLFRRNDGRSALTADANRVIFFNPGRPYRVSHPIAGGDDCTVFALSAARARELVGAGDPRAAEREVVQFPVDHVLVSTHAARLHLEILTRARRGDSALQREDAVAELLSATVALPATGAVTARHREVTEAACLAIAANVVRPPSLSRLADEFGYSPFHLSHVVRRAAGLSLRAYHSRLRARLAAERILEGARDLTELALDLGYSDHSHLSSSFKREWGTTPSAFRSRFRHRLAQDRSSR
jgi:AraC-like DNA-binding protein